ncbi:hypothetical protein EIP86_004780 [Pleurotus ostreatoroseus]|nr:hypothetical protein EIP86_004780 [Pleurotus ostreatoroseus]
MIIKTRRFTARPKLSRPNQPVSGEQHEPSPKELKNNRKRTVSPKKRKAGANSTTARKRTAARKGKGKQKARDDSEDSAMETQDEDDQDPDGAAENSPENSSSVPRRSTRQRKLAAGGYHEQDEENDEVVSDNEAPQNEETSHMQVAPVDALPDPEVKTEATEPTLLANTSNTAHTEPITVEDDLEHDAPASNKQPLDPLPGEDDEEEDKPKPIMSLKYRGFTIHGRCLCVIVEPYPPLRQQRSLSLAPTGLVGPRAPSIAPPDFVPSGGAAQRARTPLFLPEPEWDKERSVTPAPAQQRVLPPVPLFNEDPPERHEDAPDGGMLAFSQILQSVGSYTMGGLEDDDDLDGMVFLGDADEAREM